MGKEEGRIRPEDHRSAFYQQVHSQKYDNQNPQPKESQTDNDYYYEYYLKQSTENPEMFGISGPSNYEHQRGLRQMSHYFDVNGMPTAIPPSESPGLAQRHPDKPSAAQLRYYQEQKEKRKKIKNKWLYD